MFRTAYDTTACVDHLMAKTVNEIQKHKTMGGEQLEYQTDQEHYDYGVSFYILTPGIAPIPPFGHPLVIKPDNSEYEYIVSDARGAMRLNQNGKAVIGSTMDHQLIRNRGILQAKWLDKIHFVDLLNVGNFPMKAYTRWIGDNISSRLGLAPDVQVRVQIILAFFYQCLFMQDSQERSRKEELLTRDEKAKIGGLITRGLGIPANTVMDLIAELPIAHDVKDLIRLLKEHSQSSRFETFTVELLFVIIGGSWYGTNKVELMAVAVEHPPTWLGVLFSAADEQGWKNTYIGKIIKQYNRNEDLELFVRSVGKLVA